MFHSIHFPQIAAVQHNRQLEQKKFLQRAHALQKPIRRELRAFARAIWFAERGPGFLFDRRYRLRKEIRPGQVFWWIEQDIPPYDHYRCAAYRVELRQISDGKGILSFQTGLQRYDIDLNDLSALHRTMLQVSHDPAMNISRRMGAAFD